MRRLGWLSISTAVLVLAASAGGTRVSGQQEQQLRPYGTPPPLVITAFGGKEVTYKAPRTPWGDPDLQGVWSSDDMQGVSIAGGGRGGGRGGPGRGARAGAPGAPGAAAAGAPAAPAAPPAAAAPTAPAAPQPLYLDEAALKQRQDQISASAKRSDGAQTDGSFRFDYARRAFPQTRLLVDPPDGRMPQVLSTVVNRQMPRGTEGVGEASTRSVVTSSMLIILSDVILVKLIFFFYPQVSG